MRACSVLSACIVSPCFQISASHRLSNYTMDYSCMGHSVRSIVPFLLRLLKVDWLPKGRTSNDSNFFFGTTNPCILTGKDLQAHIYYADWILAGESIKVFAWLFSKNLVALTNQLHLGLKTIHLEFKLICWISCYCTAGIQQAKRDSNAWLHHTTEEPMVRLPFLSRLPVPVGIATLTLMLLYF